MLLPNDARTAAYEHASTVLDKTEATLEILVDFHVRIAEAQIESTSKALT
jgi:hypothetical protein